MCGGAVEADLLSVYGVDVLDLYRGTLSLRRVAVLIEALPPGSAVFRAEHNDAEWTQSDHLLAHVIDLLAAANWQRSAKASKSNYPKPFPRPADIAAQVTKGEKAQASARAWVERQQRQLDQEAP